MEMHLLLQGFRDILNVQVILWCLLGVTIGTLVGALPGLGPTTGTAILLPLCYNLSTLNALMLLMGVYQGCMYGGRISSILINVPGDAPAMVSTFDGYPMTKQGRAGYALALSAIASFVGGTIGFLGLIFFTPVVSSWAYVFGPPEYFSLMLFALIATSGLGGNKLLKGLISIAFGLLIAMIGTDAIEGTQRLTFGLIDLWDGIDLVVVAVGVFGLSEVLLGIEKNEAVSFGEKIPFRDLFPTLQQILGNTWSIIRGSLTGFFVGLLPGAGATIATFLTYSVEKKLSRTPEKFGTGIDQGLSAPEAANNASVGGALIPLFTLGIPGSGTTAIILGALIMFGLQPGPLMMQKSGKIIWATIAGLMFANVLLLILNTAFVPFFTKLIQKVQTYMAPLIAALCFIGVYLVNNSFFDVGLMIIFGIIGYFLRKHDFPVAPLVLGLVLGGMIEKSFRQAMLISNNHLSIFLTRPISLVLLVITLGILIWPFLRIQFRK